MATIPECDGSCCRRFTLNLAGPSALRRWVANTQLVSRGVEAGPHAKWNTDLVFWAPYLTYVGESDDGDHLWSCGLFDDATGLCTMYEHRPEACVEYPNGQSCKHCGGSG